MKLFISSNSVDPDNIISFRRNYIVADKINTLDLSELQPFGSGEYQIEGTLDNGNNYWCFLGGVGKQRAYELRRELCEWMARAAASTEPTALLLECHGGAWRQH